MYTQVMCAHLQRYRKINIQNDSHINIYLRVQSLMIVSRMVKACAREIRVVQWFAAMNLWEFSILVDR